MGDLQIVRLNRDIAREQMALVDEVKAKLSIVDVVSDYVTLQNPYSSSPKALCPFHEERTPSFTIYPDQGTWRCYGACAEGGDIFSFVMRADGTEFSEALDKLCEMAGVERTRDLESESKALPSAALYNVNRIAQEFFHRQLVGNLGKEALEYLGARGIDAQTALKRGVGFAPGGINSLIEYLKSLGADSKAAIDAGLIVRSEDGTWHDMFSNRITISIRDARGNIVGFGARAMGDAQPKYLNTHATSIFDKSALLYGIDWAAEAVRATGQAIIVEGYMDVIAAHEHGFKNVVASMGTAVTTQQLRSLTSRLEGNDQTRSVVLCLDNDAAGRQATISALRTAMTEFGAETASKASSSAIEIKVATPVASENGEAKDPDEAIRHNSAEWRESVNAAVEIMEFIIEAHTLRHDLQTDQGVDALLIEIEPYFSAVPPNMVADMKRLRNLASRLSIDYSSLIDAMTLKRSARISASKSALRAAPPSAKTGRARRNAPAPAMSASTAPLQAPWELDLMACIVQHAVALDHAHFVRAEHFRNPQLGELLESLRSSRSAPETSGFIPENGSIGAMFHELMGHTLTPDSEDGMAEEADIIAITRECAKRTHREHLIRKKKMEAEEAGKHGNLIPRENLVSAVESNEQIRQLSSV